MSVEHGSVLFVVQNERRDVEDDSCQKWMRNWKSRESDLTKNL